MATQEYVGIVDAKGDLIWNSSHNAELKGLWPDGPCLWPDRNTAQADGLFREYLEIARPGTLDNCKYVKVTITVED